MNSADQPLRLRTVLSDLENGRMKISDAAAHVRKMHFPVPADKTVAQRMADSYESEVPAAAPPGSFREVALAYHSGRITYQEYKALAEAAAAAIKADQGEEAGSSNELPEGQGTGGSAGQPEVPA